MGSTLLSPLLIFAEQTVWLCVAAGLMGLIVGSFLTVVAYRVPLPLMAQEPAESSTSTNSVPPFNIVWPGSHCPQCKTPLQVWQNIPVVGYLLQKGRCSYCADPISIRYPVIELTTALAFVGLAWHFGFGVQLALALVFAGFLVSLSAIDIEHYILPDSLTLSLLWLGLLANTAGAFVPIESAVWGAAFGYASLWLIHHAFLWIRKKEGLGYGDFKLLAAIGAWLGVEALPWILFGAACLGAVVGVVGILAFKRDQDSPLPFGPFLSAAGFGALLLLF
ncbi:MAG: hypothetical protein RIR28_683 [Pseudomonadota bacterium]